MLQHGRMNRKRALALCNLLAACPVLLVEISQPCLPCRSCFGAALPLCQRQCSRQPRCGSLLPAGNAWSLRAARHRFVALQGRALP